MTSPVPIRVLFSTVGSEADARRLARQLVEENLAACVSVLPLAASVYRWQGRVEEEPEFLLWIKTGTETSTATRLRLEEIHPYDLPEIVELDGSASSTYGRWLLDSLAGRA